MMEKLTWDLLTEVYGRGEGELIKSMLNANEIEVELFQEAAGSNYAYPTSVGEFARVQIFVPKSKFELARELLNTSQLNTTQNDQQS
jgi:hypothetical protein